MTQNQVTLALAGWIPMRGLLDHALWNPTFANLVRPCDSGYIWSHSPNPGQHTSEISWDQWPDCYSLMEWEVLNGASPLTSGNRKLIQHPTP